jgi:hypothetical protein
MRGDHNNVERGMGISLIAVLFQVDYPTALLNALNIGIQRISFHCNGYLVATNCKTSS